MRPSRHQWDAVSTNWLRLTFGKAVYIRKWCLTCLVCKVSARFLRWRPFFSLWCSCCVAILMCCLSGGPNTWGGDRVPLKHMYPSSIVVLPTNMLIPEPTWRKTWTPNTGIPNDTEWSKQFPAREATVLPKATANYEQFDWIASNIVSCPIQNHSSNGIPCWYRMTAASRTCSGPRPWQRVHRFQAPVAQPPGTSTGAIYSHVPTWLTL